MWPIVFWNNAHSQKYWVYTSITCTYVMNKKEFFLFFVPFVFPCFYTLPTPNPHAFSCLSPFSYPHSSLLHFLFYLFLDLFLVLNATPISANDLQCMYLTNKLSSFIKSIMSSLPSIFLLSWPSLINITKDDLLHVAARRKVLYLSMIGDWGGLRHTFCHSSISIADKYRKTKK